jgi:hypothetical protein
VVEVRKAGFPDAVVWNPWIAKAQAMGDFGDEEYKVWHSYTFNLSAIDFSSYRAIVCRPGAKPCSRTQYHYYHEVRHWCE